MAPDASHFTDRDFPAEVLRADVPVLVDFWAAWCPPCRAIAPTIEALAADYRGVVKVGKLDIDENPATAEAYEVRAIPTLLVFRGGKVVDRLVGAASRARIEAMIRAAA
jgi:thioredoxin